MEAHYFIGIKIPATVAEALDQERKAWKLTSHKRYTAPVDMHITLLFIGSDPHGEIAQTAEALAGIKHSPFELSINGIGTFGKPAVPRIIFASVAESEELRKLQEKVKKTIMPFELKPDLKPFVPHITLAGKWAGGPPLEQELQVEPMAFTVDQFSLFRVNPRNVPKYIAESTYHLKEGV